MRRPVRIYCNVLRVCNPFRRRIRLWRQELLPPLRRGSQQKTVIEQQKSEYQNEVVQECVIRSEDDWNLPSRHDEKADDAPAPWQKQHEHQSELERQRGAGCEGVEAKRQVLRVPANPRGQRAVLIVLVHGGEVAPLGIAASELHHTRLKVDAKPLPLQQK